MRKKEADDRAAAKAEAEAAAAALEHGEKQLQRARLGGETKESRGQGSEDGSPREQQLGRTG